MPRLRRRAFASSMVAVALSIAIGRQACGQQRASHELAADPSARAAFYRPTAPAPLLSDHPLAPVLRFARAEQTYLRQTVRDFTCRLVKRERIDGMLQDYCHIDMQVREEIREGDQVVRPMSIFLKFMAPSKVAGRKVLYVAGQHEDKMLVRNGGRHFDYVVVEVDPWGESARKESLVPITQTGFNDVLGQMIDVLQRHAQADSTGQNTQVQRIVGAKVNQRPCTTIRIVHPKKQAGLEFHVANVFIDDALRIPVRVDFSAWPKQPNQPPPLLAEYTYTDLQLNVNLPDRVFSPSLLREHR